MSLPTEDCAASYHRRTSMLAQPGDALLPTATPPHSDFGVALPYVKPATGPSLEQAIGRRRTERHFDPRAGLTLAELARLLVLSCGRTEGGDDAAHRAVPSAGAAYPVDVYVIVQRVAGLPPGAYGYDAGTHRLALRRAGRFAAGLARWTLDQPWMARAATVFVLVGTLARLQPRYASRGYRYMLFEAGHVAQNLCLLGAARGLCVQPAGGFVDLAFDRLLALDDGQRSLYLLAVGPGAPVAPAS